MEIICIEMKSESRRISPTISLTAPAKGLSLLRVAIVFVILQLMFISLCCSFSRVFSFYVLPLMENKDALHTSVGLGA